MELYTLSSKIYYDNDEYKKIIFLDKKPEKNGMLQYIVKYISPSKLSTSIYEYNNKCIYAILNPNNLNELLKIEDISILFTWLFNNGYNINTNFTEIIQRSKLQIKNNMICFISSN